MLTASLTRPLKVPVAGGTARAKARLDVDACRDGHLLRLRGIALRRHGDIVAARRQRPAELAVSPGRQRRPDSGSGVISVVVAEIGICRVGNNNGRAGNGVVPSVSDGSGQRSIRAGGQQGKVGAGEPGAADDHHLGDGFIAGGAGRDQERAALDGAVVVDIAAAIRRGGGGGGGCQRRRRGRDGGACGVVHDGNGRIGKRRIRGSVRHETAEASLRLLRLLNQVNVGGLNRAAVLPRRSHENRHVIDGDAENALAGGRADRVRQMEAEGVIRARRQDTE